MFVKRIVAAAFLSTALLGSGAALAVPVNGSDSFVTNVATGVSCNGNLAVGVTCTNFGSIFWDGGATGDFLLVAPGTPATDVALLSLVGQVYSFTSAAGNFLGSIISVTTGGSGNNLSLTDVILGTFTPAGVLSGFTAGPASMTLAYTETINSATGLGSFSISETIASPPSVIRTPEPTTLALLGIALAGLGFVRRTRS